MKIKIAILFMMAALSNCGGGGGNGEAANDKSGYAGTWQINLAPDTLPGETPCISNPQPISEIVTINQNGSVTAVKFESGDVLIDAGSTLSGRVEGGQMIAGIVEAKVACGNGQTGDQVQTLVFFNENNGVSTDVRRVRVNPCGANKCNSVWIGTAEKL